MRPDEIADALRGEIGRCAVRATELASLWESAGAQAFMLVDEISGCAEAEEIARYSHGIRGLVVHGLLVLAELQHVAGRLDALSALRGAERASVDRS